MFSGTDMEGEGPSARNRSAPVVGSHALLLSQSPSTRSHNITHVYRSRSNGPIVVAEVPIAYATPILLPRCGITDARAQRRCDFL